MGAGGDQGIGDAVERSHDLAELVSVGEVERVRKKTVAWYYGAPL